jgi:phospholipid N-methyltransferase
MFYYQVNKIPATLEIINTSSVTLKKIKGSHPDIFFVIILSCFPSANKKKNGEDLETIRE